MIKKICKLITSTILSVVLLSCFSIFVLAETEEYTRDSMLSIQPRGLIGSESGMAGGSSGRTGTFRIYSDTNNVSYIQLRAATAPGIKTDIGVKDPLLGNALEIPMVVLVSGEMKQLYIPASHRMKGYYTVNFWCEVEGYQTYVTAALYS